jgi:hypothetical protein
VEKVQISSHPYLGAFGEAYLEIMVLGLKEYDFPSFRTYLYHNKMILSP